MNYFQSLDRELTGLYSGFAAAAATLDMPLICSLNDEATIARQRYKGIYRIDVCTEGPRQDLQQWMQAFKAEWEHADYVKSFTPNLKRKRLAMYSTLPDWIPIYLGKSKNVGKRVLEHINLGMAKTTFALKLKARRGMMARQFRLYAIEVPVENYDLILSPLESALRERFNPIIGKQ